MLQSRQLFTELPEPLGVLVTEGLRLGSLDSTVRVVEASLSLQTLVHSAEDRGLSPGLGGLNEDRVTIRVVDQSEASIQVM